MKQKEDPHTVCRTCGVKLRYTINKTTGFCDSNGYDCAKWPDKEKQRIQEVTGKHMTGEETDQVNHPPHYNAGPIECIDAIEAVLGENAKYYYQGVVLKYLWRMEHKGKPLQDIEKAEWYANRLTQTLKKYSN